MAVGSSSFFAFLRPNFPRPFERGGPRSKAKGPSPAGKNIWIWQGSAQTSSGYGTRTAARRSAVPKNSNLLFLFSPNSEMEMAVVPRGDLVSVRHKAVLKHAQSKCWREVWWGPANAKRLDCVRFIAAVSHPHPTRSAAKIRCEGSPNFGFRVQETAAADRSPSRPSSRSRPSKIVSGCGGQPGMNKSTGTTALAPFRICG